MEQMKVPQNVLSAIFEEQRKLIDEYIRIEGLPEPPLNLALKKHQNLIREFMARFTNEFCEAFDCLVEAYDAANHNQKEKAQEHCEEYNIEMADAVHFLAELLIYCGLDADKLQMEFHNFLRAKDINVNDDFDRPLKDMFDYNLYVHGMDLKKWAYDPNSFRIFGFDERFDLGARNISWEILEEHAKNGFIVIYEFNKALNLLKNKDWKQTDGELNTIAFHEALLKAFLSFVYYLELAGIGESSLYINYMRKNEILYERFKNKY